MDPAGPMARATRRAPRLLLLVFGIFLVLVGITGSALVAVTSVHLAGATLTAVVERDRSLIDLFANGNLTAEDLGTTPGASRIGEIHERLEALVRTDEIVRLEIRDRAGAPVVAAGGTTGLVPAADLLAAALDGEAGAVLADAGGTTILQEHLPLLAPDGTVLGVAVLHRDASAITASLEAMRGDVLMVTVVAALVLATILLVVFRAAQQRLVRQQRQLADAARRDALTGLLNHGAVVTLLASVIEDARPAGAPTAVALVDVDNFRLFNATHGHDAGDAVLLRVSELVSGITGSGVHVARYGPDEFLVVCPGANAADLGPAIDQLRHRVRTLGFRFGESEELPVSVSIGIAAAPEHAGSVTPLLSAASVALAEAQASGGDAVATARQHEDGAPGAGSFDVLQGLVLAVDTKDRYTKRHSEDVARYAVFLARRLGCDDMLEAVRLGGLLHDIGKIGIPDALLRKPSRLTDAEVKVFNQHVALGDAIVRDLPELDEVRAAIRHHHERWDGGGYLAGLAGEEIPLIARIIAVADAFSAMTTTRPYRKALSVDEALRRLRDAAGTQLQPELVETFATGIETDPAAPAPNETGDVWLPLRVA